MAEAQVPADSESRDSTINVSGEEIIDNILHTITRCYVSSNSLGFKERETTVPEPSSTGVETLTYRLNVTQNAWLEGPDNYYSGHYLIIAKHPDYPKKRSLIQFQDIPANCRHIHQAKMYVHFAYCHKASWLTPQQVPFITRKIQVHCVKKPWVQNEVTSAYRQNGVRWSRPWLALDGTDADPDPQDSVVLSKDRPKDNFLEFDITKAARSWSAGLSNYGLLIWATNEDVEGRDVRFSSMGSQNAPFVLVKCEI